MFSISVAILLELERPTLKKEEDLLQRRDKLMRHLLIVVTVAKKETFTCCTHILSNNTHEYRPRLAGLLSNRSLGVCFGRKERAGRFVISLL